MIKIWLFHSFKKTIYHTPTNHKFKIWGKINNSKIIWFTRLGKLCYIYCTLHCHSLTHSHQSSKRPVETTKNFNFYVMTLVILFVAFFVPEIFLIAMYYWDHFSDEIAYHLNVFLATMKCLIFCKMMCTFVVIVRNILHLCYAHLW